MIYEVRTTTLRPRTLPQVEERLTEAYAARSRHSQLAGCFRPEVGTLNEIVEFWPYADLAERARVREAAAQDAPWPPDIADFVLDERVEIVRPFPFAPTWTPGNDGPLYELRQYTFRSGALPLVMDAWREALPVRLPHSAPALVGAVEIGWHTSSFMHLWPYPSMERRGEVRAAANATGKWPPASGQHYLTQQNRLLVPLPFSPAQ